ncbi:histidine phosphotransferase family protein [Celeribacter halophilus]|uniref:Histidine phosphotransferase family protein n=1 Tax=Celeribacter halophilus TaxID=576117 RepID=A0AAW7XR42_9RHOB|nr:histidine phosphotransferase family protein [Celeribacter halophilus]MDO6455484.1 histidine phosphotransferase family protein [Celeribacter halophilus]MDO6721688.1 histidine phosphotransferase family protein [Celeribacter halophilus]
MTQDLTRDIAAMIGSRICHDLISPVGAIANGVELMAMQGAGTGPELSLISESVENANARVKFFRIAFGMASSGQMMSKSEISGILKGLTSARLGYVWEPEDDLPREEVKLACLMLMCLESALPRGGRIEVGFTDNHWQITASAERIDPAPDLWARLGEVTGAEGMKPSEVQFLLAPLQADSLGRTIAQSTSDGTITLTA